MGKKNILLDFTSLLDVIMIILFVVICKLGQASMEVNASAQEAIAKADVAQEALEEAQGALEDAQAELERMTKRDTIQTSIIEELEGRNEALTVENEELKAAAEESFDREKVMEELLGNSLNLQLICSTYTDENKSASQMVNITIYKEQESEELEAGRIVTFVHDYELSAERRAVKNAQMQKELYDALYEAWRGSNADFLLISVEYTYADVNFSQTDLDIIYGAVEDLERECGIKCFINKIKL